jgi:glycosyltransferase involved in cell wall biosynthesis
MIGAVANAAPRVTVVVGCYNHARFVEECLDSVRAQTFRDWELIVFDDCSADNSVAVIDRWVHKHRIKCQLIQHAHNVGICKSLNEAIRLARGEYISIVAADDAWLPDKLGTQVCLLDDLPATVGVVYSDAYQIDEKGNVLPDMFIASHRKLDSFPQGRINEILWGGNFIPAMTTLVRKTCYDDVGLYDENLSFEDWDMWLRVSEKFDFHFSPQPSARYRIVASSMMRSKTDWVRDSVAQIALKFLTRGKLAAVPRNAAIAILAEYAEGLYRRGDPRAAMYVRLALRYRKSARLMASHTCITLGVPRSLVRKIFYMFKKAGLSRSEADTADPGGN